MACHPRHLGIIEGAHTNFIVGTQDAECRRDTTDVLGMQPSDGAAEEHHAEHPDPPVPSHPLPFLSLVNSSPAVLPYSTRHTSTSSPASHAPDTFASVRSASLPLLEACCVSVTLPWKLRTLDRPPQMMVRRCGYNCKQ